MTFDICPRCGSNLENYRCPGCGGLFIPRCAQCGNTLVFEEVEYNGVGLLRWQSAATKLILKSSPRRAI